MGRTSMIEKALHYTVAPPFSVKDYSMTRRVTIEEIARQSGVSLATVSLVLRDKPGITEETRRRVIDTARSLGYQRRPQAGSVALLDLQQIGVIVKTRPDDQPQANPFYAPVLAGVEAMCRKSQINLLYATVPVDLDNHPLALPRMLLEDQIDGVLLVGAFVDHTIEHMLRQRNTPVVLVDAYATEQCYDAVVSDNFRGAYEAVSYLVQRGHHHIGMVGSLPNAYPSITERRRGYVQALVDHQISGRYFADSHIDMAEVAAATGDLLRREPQITALFCCNDATALSAMRAAQAGGWRTPEDLSIVGFDDIDLAAHVVPALTTMRVDKIGMGRLAVQLLANRAEFPNAACATVVLRPTLVERESVRGRSS
jgi:LacI family transcriptional regulator, galactose operon repressor